MNAVFLITDGWECGSEAGVAQAWGRSCEIEAQMIYWARVAHCPPTIYFGPHPMQSVIRMHKLMMDGSFRLEREFRSPVAMPERVAS